MLVFGVSEVEKKKENKKIQMYEKGLIALTRQYRISLEVKLQTHLFSIKKGTETD